MTQTDIPGKPEKHPQAIFSTYRAYILVALEFGRGRSWVPWCVTSNCRQPTIVQSSLRLDAK